MSESTSQEPTMEEILASIRRIISEDDAPAADAAAPAEAAAEPEPMPEPDAFVAPEPVAAVAADEDEDDALELTDRVETVGDLEVYTPPSAAAPEPTHAPEPVRAYDPPADHESLLGQAAASSAAAAFGSLSAAIRMPAEGRTLEDVVRELLKPLLKQWLDDNLPRIVQASVDEEVERIARGRVR